MLLVKRTGEAAKSSKTTPTERSKIILTSSFFTLFFFFKPYISTSPQEKKADLMAVLSSVPASCVGSHRFLITKGTSFYQSFAWILESPRPPALSALCPFDSSSRESENLEQNYATLICSKSIHWAERLHH